METIMTKLSKVFKPIVTSIANDIKSIETNVSKLEQEFDKLSSEGTGTPSPSTNNLKVATAKVMIGEMTNNNGEEGDAYLVFNRVGNNVSVYLECEDVIGEGVNLGTPVLNSSSLNDHGILTDKVPKGFSSAHPVNGVILAYINWTPLTIDGSRIYIQNHKFYQYTEMATIVLNYTTTDEFPAE